jgi:lysophospholipase L1-like esterase
MRRRTLLLSVPLVAAAVATSVVTAGPASAGKPSGGGTSTVPSSMDALGDSITRGFNACGFYFDCTDRSWSTGTDATVNSHYSRLLAKSSAIQGKNYNDAVSGAKVADLPGQASTAASRGVQYVTVLVGANDACTSSESTMTSVASFRAAAQTALDTLRTQLPNTKVLVVSIPDIKRLWYIGKDSSSARTAWSSYSICQSMLANPTSTDPVDEDRRNRVRQRVVDFNAALAEICAQNVNCKYDGNAVFNYQFVLSQVSGWDYFHPNTSGQAVIANVTWAAPTSARAGVALPRAARPGRRVRRTPP